MSGVRALASGAVAATLAAVLAAVLAAALAGCSALGASASSTAITMPSKLAQAQRTHEYPSPRPPAQTVRGGGAPDAVTAIRAFATGYINWTAGTVSQEMRTLAAASVGQARAMTQLAAAQTAGDYELQRGGIANSGTVEAIARVPGRRDEYLVVTREQTSATNTNAYQGLRPAWHVALATVVQTGRAGWVVSSWQPEN